MMLALATLAATLALPLRNHAGAAVQLSTAQKGRTIAVPLGDSVLVAMRDGRTWRVANADPTILAPRIGVMWMRGVQGGYVTKRIGRDTLRLSAPGARPVIFRVNVIAPESRHAPHY